MDYIIDVLADGMEQGSVSNSGNVDDSRMVRSIGYLPFLGDDDGKITVSATATTGKTVLVSFLGYDSDTTVTPLFCWYWYSLPHVFDISSYPNVKFFRLVLIYTGYETLPLNEVASCTLTYNYSWEMDSEDGAIPEKALSIPDSSFTKPYPASLWRIDESNDGYPYNELMPDILYYEPAQTLGAFQGVASLTAVRIPVSVKAIGAEAFAGTALRRVKIAADCAYEETSFPAGCVVEHYDDDRYEQLRDCDGRAILDCDARRIYVRKVENTNG